MVHSRAGTGKPWQEFETLETSNVTQNPHVTRVRHEIKRRLLTVARKQQLTPAMVRIVLTGDELAGFTSLGFDDHVKLFFPTGTPAAAGEEPADAARDFTPRRFDAQAGELWIDFFVHETGPATNWATQAREGDTLVVGGPKGSAMLAIEGVDLHLFIGDETAIPAIARRLEELPAHTRALVVAEVDPGTSWPAFETAAQCEVIWVHRSAAGADSPGADLIERLRSVQIPAERCFVWVALESQAARTIRRYMCDERGVPKAWIKASAYWQRGAVGKHERIES